MSLVCAQEWGFHEFGTLVLLLQPTEYRVRLRAFVTVVQILDNPGPTTFSMPTISALHYGGGARGHDRFL